LLKNEEPRVGGDWRASNVVQGRLSMEQALVAASGGNAGDTISQQSAAA